MRVSVTELKARLSEYLRRVKQGETIEILERSVVVARIQRTRPMDETDDERLARLVREGIVQAPRAEPDASRLDFDPIPCDGDAIQTLIDQRDDR